MNTLFRYLTSFAEGLVYGPTYAVQQHLIRNPKPVDPQYIWHMLNRPLPAIFEWFRQNYPPAFTRRFLLAAKMKQDHLLGISEHYDVSNEFYKLILDSKYMFYSCADFHSDDESLEEAQTHKADFLLDLIDPHPGEKILDLGCGWGSMLKRIYEETGDKDHLYGYTLSQEQVNHNRDINGFNVEFKNFITCDYPKNEFDKIYSIGSWEHVRWPDLPVVLEKLHAALKPGGRLVKHFFCLLDSGIGTSMIGAQIYFPGSILASYDVHTRSFEEAGFRIAQRSIHDYRPTLRAWFDNLVARRDEAIEMVGVRTYNKYVVFLASSHRLFDDNEAILLRFLLEKPSNQRTEAAAAIPRETRKVVSGS